MRRTILLLSTMTLTLLMASGVALAETTTSTNPSSISIVDATQTEASPANPYPSEINVQGLGDPISDVNVTLKGYSHGFPDDVAVQLVGPDGTSALLMSDAGGHYLSEIALSTTSVSPWTMRRRTSCPTTGRYPLAPTSPPREAPPSVIFSSIIVAKNGWIIRYRVSGLSPRPIWPRVPESSLGLTAKTPTAPGSSTS